MSTWSAVNIGIKYVIVAAQLVSNDLDAHQPYGYVVGVDGLGVGGGGGRGDELGLGSGSVSGVALGYVTPVC